MVVVTRFPVVPTHPVTEDGDEDKGEEDEEEM